MCVCTIYYITCTAKQVKEIRSKFQDLVTVNDILAAVLNMAIRRYFEDKKEPLLLTPGMPAYTRTYIHAHIHTYTYIYIYV